jgi:hypothetical protein
MIHKLPEPIHGQTHVRVLYINERPEADITVEGELGTMDGEEFVAAPEFRTMVVRVNGEEVRGKYNRPGFRREDLLTQLDELRWRNPRAGGNEEEA